MLERCLCRARCDTLHVDCRWPAGGRPHAQTVTVQFPPAGACAAPPAAGAACHCHVTAPRSTLSSLYKARPRRRPHSVTPASQLGETQGWQLSSTHVTFRRLLPELHSCCPQSSCKTFARLRTRDLARAPWGDVQQDEDWRAGDQAARRCKLGRLPHAYRAGGCSCPAGARAEPEHGRASCGPRHGAQHRRPAQACMRVCERARNHGAL